MTTLSAYVPAPLWAVGEVTPVERLTLIAIASLKEGLWGTVSWFSEYTGMNRAQLSRTISKLLKKGALTKSVKGRRQAVVVDETWVANHQQTLGVPGVTQQGPLTEATEMLPAANAKCITDETPGDCCYLQHSAVAGCNTTVATGNKSVASCNTEIQEEKSIYTMYISMGSLAIVTTYDETGRLLTSEPCDPDYARAHDADAMADASNKDKDRVQKLKDLLDSLGKDHAASPSESHVDVTGAGASYRSRVSGDGSAGAPQHKWSVQVPVYEDVLYCLTDHFRIAIDRARDLAAEVIEHYTTNGRNWRRGRYRIQVKDLPRVLVPWADRDRQSQPMPRSVSRKGGYKDADGWTYYRNESFIACPRDMPPPATMEVA